MEMHEGHWIKFKNTETGEIITKQIASKHYYSSVRAALEGETLQAALPNETEIQAGENIYNNEIYNTAEKQAIIAKEGMVALRFH